MINKFIVFLRRQSLFGKIVAFFGALGIIASTLLTIKQLINLFHEPPKNPTSVIVSPHYIRNHQGDQGTIGDHNINTWNNTGKPNQSPKK